MAGQERGGRLIDRSPMLAFGFLLAASTCVGQTYFIALFGGHIRADLGLSHGAFGGLYTLATAVGALGLVWLGRAADRIGPVRLSLVTLAGLALAALLMASAQSALVLGLALFALRALGQGMLGHVMITAITRWFQRRRGRALSIAMLGFSAAEAALPVLVALALGAMVWRQIWLIAAATLLLVVAPMIAVLGRLIADGGVPQAATGGARPAGGASSLVATDQARPAWTRPQVLRDPRFYALLPGLLAPPFIITGMLFHQVHLVESKGWVLAEFAALFPGYAIAATATSLGLGVLIDRFGSARLLPFYLLPLLAGLGLLAFGSSLLAGGGFLALAGSAGGAAAILPSTLWAELYGTTHLGAIRSVAMAATVLSTAAAPGLMGVLIDSGVAIEQQAAGLALYTAAVTLSLALLRPRLKPTAPRAIVPAGA